MTLKHLANSTVARENMEHAGYQVKIIDESDLLATVADGYYVRATADGEAKKVPFIVIKNTYDEQELMNSVRKLGETCVEDFTHVEFTNGVYAQEVQREQEKLAEAEQLFEPFVTRMFEKAAGWFAKIPLKVQLHQGQGDLLETFFMKIQDRLAGMEKAYAEQEHRHISEMQGLWGTIQSLRSAGAAYGARTDGGDRAGEAATFGANQPAYGRWGRPGFGGTYPTRPATRHPSDVPQPRRVGDPVTVQQEADNGGRVMSSGRFPTSAPGLHDRIGSVGSMLKGLQETKRGMEGALAGGRDFSYTADEINVIWKAVYQFNNLTEAERDQEIGDLIEQTNCVELFGKLSNAHMESVKIMIESQLNTLSHRSEQMANDLMGQMQQASVIVSELHGFSINSIEAIVEIVTATIKGFAT